MSRLRSNRGLVLGATVLLLALFLVRPGATRLKLRITGAIGQALERPVEIGTVKVHLLPTPGFDLEAFVVREDPAFGVEPVLRAPEVAAVLRLSSLLHGRLEISRLVLTEPSLNLVRNAEGRWNIENVLQRAAQTAVAPTAAKGSAARPAFPYIEADHGRVNFKFGAEKKSFVLTDADYAIWQDSENAWGVRLKARPVRTDFNLSDTGQVRISGTWQRSASLRSTPVQFTLQWDQAQLGQLTKLVSGEDRGWRGALQLSASLAGTPADLLVHSEAALEDFRHYDILDEDVLRMHAACDAHYSTAARGFDRVACLGPLRDGAVSLRGDLLNLLGPRSYDLTFVLQRVPMQAVLALVRHARKDLARDLQAGGTVSASFHVGAGKGQGQHVLEGTGRISDLRLKSEAAGTDLVFGQVPLSLVPAGPEAGRLQPKADTQERTWERPLSEPYLALGPFAVRLGRGTPASARARITPSAYDLDLQGDADLQSLLQLARTLGLAAPQAVAEGSTRVDLQLAGQWAGRAAVPATGNLQLRTVRAEVRGLNAPLDIASAKLRLGAEHVTVEALSASIRETHWTGSIEWPRGCTAAGPCAVSFALHADQLDTDRLSQLLSPTPSRRPWYHFLSPESPAGPPLLARIHAIGRLSVDQFTIRRLAATHVLTDVELDHGQLRLADLRAQVLGGKHRGNWQADFGVAPPAYSGEGSLERISLAQLGDLMHDGWITGIGSATYALKTAGYSSAALLASADGSLRFEMSEGAFPHVVLGSTILRVRRFAGNMAVHDGRFEMRDARLESPSGTFLVTGTASLENKLDFKLSQDGASAFNIIGTVGEPRTAHAETQAALRPSSTQR